VSPTYSFDAAMRALWGSLLNVAPYAVGAIAVLALGVLVAEWAAKKLAERWAAASPPEPAPVGASSQPGKLLRMLAGASSVYAPLAYAAHHRAAAACETVPSRRPGCAEALAQFPAAVCLVTVRDRQAQPRGIVLTSLCVYSIDPPSVLLCVGRDGDRHDLLLSSRPFGVHLLDCGQQLMAHRCEHDDCGCFEGTDWRWDDGVPVLEGGVAYLRCEPATTKRHGDHAVVIGHVVDAVTRPGRGDPLLHLRGRTDWRVSANALVGSAR
jgi:flavin reductase ActVB